MRKLGGEKEGSGWDLGSLEGKSLLFPRISMDISPRNPWIDSRSENRETGTQNSRFFFSPRPTWRKTGEKKKWEKLGFPWKNLPKNSRAGGERHRVTNPRKTQSGAGAGPSQEKKNLGKTPEIQEFPGIPAGSASQPPGIPEWFFLGVVVLNSLKNPSGSPG